MKALEKHRFGHEAHSNDQLRLDLDFLSQWTIMERSVRISWIDRSIMSAEDLMSGKPQFDEGAVIAAAVNVFWTHGYAATSITELTNATGLSRSSLYQRFKDKDGLFLEALKTYTERNLMRMNEVTGPSARATVEALLRIFLPKEHASKRPPGCLIARSCAEAVDLSEGGKAAAFEAITKQRKVFEDIITDGVEAGELPHDCDISALAWYYFGILQAVVNFPHAGANVESLTGMIDVAMSAWPTHPAILHP